MIRLTDFHSMETVSEIRKDVFPHSLLKRAPACGILSCVLKGALLMKSRKSDLRNIPGVGPNIEQDLLNLGYSSIASLKGADPEEIYRRDCLLKGRKEDRCQLYVYRLAVYYADHSIHDPEKLKWWHWKD